MVDSQGQLLAELLADNTYQLTPIKGEAYKILNAEGGSTKLADNLIALRSGNDLIIRFANGLEVVMLDYFEICLQPAQDTDNPEAEAQLDCSITVAGDTKEGMTIGSGPASQYELASDASPRIVYAHGDDTALASIINDNAGMEDIYAAYVLSSTAPAVAAATAVSPTLLGAAGLGVGAAAGGGGGGSAAVAQEVVKISGSVVLGPVVAGHGLTVTAYKADGSVLATGRVNDNGTFTISANGNYSGTVLVRVVDTNAAADYFDEGTRVAKDMDTDLRAATTVAGAGEYTVSVNPLTELAVQEMPLVSGNALNATSAANIAAGNESVARSVGLNSVDLIKDTAIPIVDAQGNANPNANAYGEMLAAISGMEHSQSKATNTIISNMKDNKSGNSLNSAMQYELVAGGKAANTDIVAIATRLGMSNPQGIKDVWDIIYAAADGEADNDLLPTQQQYALIGVSGVNSAPATNLIGSVIDALGSAVNSAVIGSVNSVAEVQALSNAVQSVMQAAGGAANKPSKAELELLGITGVTDENLKAVQDQIKSTADDGSGVDSLFEIQQEADIGIAKVADALAKIANYADSSTNPAPTLQDYEDAGVTGVTAAKLAAINEIIDSKAKTEADTAAEVQAIVNGAANKLAAIEKIAKYADDGQTAPSLSDYQAAGIDGVTADNLPLVNVLVEAATKAEADTEAEVEGLLNANATKLAAMAKIANYADSDSNPTPTLQDYLDAGITGVNAEKLAAVNALVEAKIKTEADTPAEVQALINDSDNAKKLTAIEKIAKYADDPVNGAPSQQDYTDAGISGVDTPAKLAAVNNAIDKATQDQADSQAEIQQIANDALAASPSLPTPPSDLQIIANYAESSTNTTPSVANYNSAIGPNIVDADNLAAVNEIIDAATKAQADTADEIRSLINNASDKINALQVIANYADNNGNTKPTLATYNAANIDGVTANTLEAVNELVDGVSKAEADTEREVEALINANAVKLAAIEKIADYAADSNKPAPTVEDYSNAGVTGVDATNLAAVNDLVDGTDRAGADTEAEIQALVNNPANQTKLNALAKIANYADDSVNNPAPTVQDYADAGITGVTADKLPAINEIIDSKAKTEADSEDEIQAIVDGASDKLNALAKIAKYADDGQTAPNLADYQAAGI